jgi:hypothetical protein
MSDNSTLPVAVGTEVFANNDIGGVKYPRAKLVWGAAGVVNDASAANPLPVTFSGTMTVSGTIAATQSGAWTVSVTGTSVVSGTVTANIGTAGPLALETGGNLAAILAKLNATINTLITQGGNTAVVKAGSVAPVPADPALVTSLSPNSGPLKVWDGTNYGVFKTTAPVATDAALVVAVSPNSQNPNGQALMTASSPVVIASNQSSLPAIAGGTAYKPIGTSQTSSLLGSVGAIGDYIEGILCIVTAPATSQVALSDGNVTFVVFPNNVGAGVGSYYVSMGWRAAIATTPGWRVTTGAGVTAVASGIFT